MFKVPYLTDFALVDSRLSKELPWCQTRINSIVNNSLILGKLQRPNCWSGQGSSAVVAVSLMHTPLWFLVFKSVCFYHVPFKINQLFYYLPVHKHPTSRATGEVWLSDTTLSKLLFTRNPWDSFLTWGMPKKEKAGFLIRNTSWDAVPTAHTSIGGQKHFVVQAN